MDRESMTPTPGRVGSGGASWMLQRRAPGSTHRRFAALDVVPERDREAIERWLATVFAEWVQVQEPLRREVEP
ncbi:MAG: hypothetical protein ABI895_30110, partial [Deltaproteobacteria bacterium]